ncbi:MAG: hypothetical protein BroJett026_23140 [Betaproteobacteria bacterium]|nr:MAG: hypothetical protein BroJett026_23140 [Betaproteobacteria bacterium]
MPRSRPGSPSPDVAQLRPGIGRSKVSGDETPARNERRADDKAIADRRGDRGPKSDPSPALAPGVRIHTSGASRPRARHGHAPLKA